LLPIPFGGFGTARHAARPARFARAFVPTEAQRTHRSLTAATKGITPATATTTASCNDRGTVENLRGPREFRILVVQRSDEKKGLGPRCIQPFPRAPASAASVPL